jgi:glycosyltransferase involved in cell wall biosynthesis
MKLLILSYSYHPAVSPRAFRWTAIAEYWARQGHSVDVVCSRLPGTEVCEIFNNVRIRRVVDPIDLMKGKVRPTQPQKLAHSAGSDSKWSRSITSLIRKVHDVTWRKLYWPDYACLWILSAYRQAKKLLESSCYDAMITVSHPFTCHVVGLMLRRHTTEQRWVCDIGDPFSYLDETPPNNQLLYASLNRRIERQVIQLANAAAVTTDETAAEYVRSLGLDRKCFTTIPPLVSVEMVHEQREKLNLDNRILRLVFLGTLYRKIRDPEFLLDLLTRLAQLHDMPRFEMHFVGGLDGCEKLFEAHRPAIGKWLFLHGRVERSRAVEYMSQADVMVNIGNKTSYQLPSKVIEYAATGKPILNIATVNRDSAHKILEGYPVSLTVFSCCQVSEETVRQVKGFLSNPQRADSAMVRRFLEPYLLPAIAEQYLNLMKPTNRHTIDR